MTYPILLWRVNEMRVQNKCAIENDLIPPTDAAISGC